MAPNNPPQGNDENDPQDQFKNLFESFFSQGNAAGFNPADFAQAAGLPNDPASMAKIFEQFQFMLSSSGSGPVNWKLAKDNAFAEIAQERDPSVIESDRKETDEAFRIAETWLDQATTFPQNDGLAQVWSRREWVENTLPVWQRITEPVAVSIGKALTQAISEQIPEELGASLGDTTSLFSSVGGALFGVQLGRAIGGLAKEVLTVNDIGIPLTETPQSALLVANVAEFTKGLEIDPTDVRIFLAIREAAHTRLFSSVPWLSSHLLNTIETYARGIVIDTDRVEELARDIDPNHPEEIQQALTSGIFLPQTTPEQENALARLETILALIEGWVDHITSVAGKPLVSLDALMETMRRRRASGGPAEHIFAALVGLELRPRRLREAAALWSALEITEGSDGRDSLWSHPDLIPAPEDLQDPEAFLDKRTNGDTEGDQLDQALEDLLNSSANSAEGTENSEEPEKDDPENPSQA